MSNDVRKFFYTNIRRFKALAGGTYLSIQFFEILKTMKF